MSWFRHCGKTSWQCHGTCSRISFSLRSSTWSHFYSSARRGQRCPRTSHDVLTEVCGGQGWQWSLSVLRATEKWCSTCGACARCRFSLRVVECLSFHDPCRSCSFGTEPILCSFLVVLGMAGVVCQVLGPLWTLHNEQSLNGSESLSEKFLIPERKKFLYMWIIISLWET